jgi:hypothetical protein
MSVTDPIQYMRSSIEAGDHWYFAMLKAMARWDQAEEVIGDRRYRYLIGGEAFDWVLLAERLVEELGSIVSPEERRALLFHGRPPLEIGEDEFQTLIGTPKYQAYLNYLYGVVVEEALQLAVEEEVAKENHAGVWSAAHMDGATVYQRIYGRDLADLLSSFQKERKLAETDGLDLTELKEFTYWLFKLRVRSLEGARVASDTRKGLAALSRVEAAYRKRNHLDVSEPEPEAVVEEAPRRPTAAEISRERVRARRARAAHFGDVNAF